MDCTEHVFKTAPREDVCGLTTLNTLFERSLCETCHVNATLLETTLGLASRRPTSKQRGGSRQRDATRNDLAPRDNVSRLTSNTSRDDVRPVATISPGHDNVAPPQTM